MAVNTDPRLQNQIIYSIYVRNHTPEGTFRAVIGDLDRIRALGTDIIWLMPIHPIGVQGKKGTLGCPYANRDYRSVNPEYGTMEDFQELVRQIHARGMKCMIDVVYNHTSPDSVLYAEHPEYFYHNKEGKPGNKVGDWADVIDLDYTNRELWQYLTDTLIMWAKLVDGFRCDVASFVPLEFWQQARRAVAKVNPDCIWLAETVHQSYGCMARRMGIYSALDFDEFSAFDLEYEYDVREAFDKYLQGKIVLSHYLDMLNFQEAMYPANYNKLRFLENHDQPRICSFVHDEQALVNYTAYLYFLKGTTLLYGGQEFENTHTPSLFEKEPFERETGHDLSALLRRLAEVKRQFGCRDWFRASADDENDIAILERGGDGKQFLGVFSLRAKAADVTVSAPDGSYRNMIDGTAVGVSNGLEALEALEGGYFDLLISDIMMPKMDGYTLVRTIRDEGMNMPVLMITAKDAFDDMRMGFLSGGDDYMVKPVNVNEMVLRVGALLRRAQMIHEHRQMIGETVLECDSLTVRRGAESMTLPQKEFMLLYKMAAFPGRIFTRQQLMDEIWGYDSETDPHTVDVHIGRLRERFHDNPDFRIVTMRGVGYKVVKA